MTSPIDAPTGRRISAFFSSGRTGTGTEIAEATHCAQNTAVMVIRDMRKAGQARIAGWHPGPINHVPVYGGGNAQDAPCPTIKDWRTGAAAKRLIAHLQAGNVSTVSELCNAIHACRKVVMGLLNRMKAEREAYIKEWRRSPSGPMAAAWAFGNRPDSKRKPTPYSNSEKAKRYRARLKEEVGEEVAAEIMRAMGTPSASVLVMEGRKVWQRGVGVMREAACSN